jgi:hypothetical protein
MAEWFYALQSASAAAAYPAASVAAVARVAIASVAAGPAAATAATAATAPARADRCRTGPAATTGCTRATAARSTPDSDTADSGARPRSAAHSRIATRARGSAASHRDRYQDAGRRLALEAAFTLAVANAAGIRTADKARRAARNEPCRDPYR